MSNANNNKGSIDTRRVGGRPKLARYKRRNHHHKVSYNDEEENIIQYKAEQAGKPDDVYLHEAGLDAIVQAHMSDENIEQLRDVCGMANNTNQIAHQANAGGFVSVRSKAEQLILSLTELIRRILRGGDLSEPTSATDNLTKGATMICKIKHGQNFQGCLDYITGKYDKDKQAKIIMHSEGIPLLDNKTVAQIFEAYATKGNNNIREPVGHYAYSFHKKDGSRVTDELIRKIVREHMELMGIKNTEFIMTRHYDTDHDHAHMMCSMVDRDGHVISTAYEKERNARICKYLTKKYGLYISEGKVNVNRDKLRGKEKVKYQFYDKVMQCKAKSADWQQFDKALRAEGLKLRFHYNNVNGKLMGIVFTDGKYTFSGRQLDNELKLSALTEKFGDLKQITHDNVRDWYEDYRQQLHYINDGQGCKAIDKAYPDFDKLFPNGKLPSGGYTSLDGLLSHMPIDYQTDFQAEHENSKDSKTSFVGLELLCDLLLTPYAKPLSIGGGGGGNNRGWRDLDDEDKEKYRFRFNYSHSNKPQFKRKR